MINQSEVENTIRKELGSYFSTQAATQNDIYRYINSAIEYIYNYRDWEFNKKVFSFIYEAVNTESELPIYCLKVFSVKKGATPVWVMDNEEWFVNDDHDGYVGIFGNMFISWETGTYHILHTPAPSSIDNTTTEINMPINFKRTIEELALAYGYSDLKLYDKVAAKMWSANGSLDRLAQRSSNPRPNNPVRLWANHRI